MSEHNAFGDIADRHIGPDPEDFDDWYSEESLEMEAALAPLDALGLSLMADPEPDPSRYASEAEFYTGVWTDADLLDSPCLLPLADDLGSYDALTGHLSNLEMTSDAATELRARVTGKAA